MSRGFRIPIRTCRGLLLKAWGSTFNYLLLSWVVYPNSMFFFFLSRRQEIRASTSSMTSVPKPLKFLRPHYGTLKAFHQTMPASDLKVCMSSYFLCSYFWLCLIDCFFFPACFRNACPISSLSWPLPCLPRVKGYASSYWMGSVKHVFHLYMPLDSFSYFEAYLNYSSLCCTLNYPGELKL